MGGGVSNCFLENETVPAIQDSCSQWDISCSFIQPRHFQVPNSSNWIARNYKVQINLKCENKKQQRIKLRFDSNREDFRMNQKTSKSKQGRKMFYIYVSTYIYIYDATHFGHQCFSSFFGLHCRFFQQLYDLTFLFCYGGKGELTLGILNVNVKVLNKI